MTHPDDQTELWHSHDVAIRILFVKRFSPVQIPFYTKRISRWKQQVRPKHLPNTVILKMSVWWQSHSWHFSSCDSINVSSLVLAQCHRTDINASFVIARRRRRGRWRLVRHRAATAACWCSAASHPEVSQLLGTVFETRAGTAGGDEARAQLAGAAKVSTMAFD